MTASSSIRFTVWRALLSAGSDQLNRRFKSAAQWLEPAHLKTLSEDKNITTEFYRIMTLQGGDELSATSMDIFEARALRREKI